MNEPILHLASSSPRRREILTALGVCFSCEGVDVDESQLDGEPAIDMVLRLAMSKASAACGTVGGNLPIIGADTVVVCGDRILGKPASKEDGLDMLALLSGRTHQVLAAVSVLHGRASKSAHSVTDVNFRDIAPDEALTYWQSGEPEGKAGAYAIQGRGGVFALSITGSYSGVVGLPVFETAQLLKWAGINLLKTTADQTKHD